MNFYVFKAEQYRERVLREEEEEEARRLEEEEARRVEEEKEKLKEEEEEAKSETSEPKLENSDLFDTEVESTQENVKSEKLPVEAEATKVKEEMNESTPPVELEKEATTAGIVLEKKKKPAYKGRLKRDVSSDDESEIGISDISDSDDENIPLSYLRKRLVSCRHDVEFLLIIAVNRTLLKFRINRFNQKKIFIRIIESFRIFTGKLNFIDYTG